MKSYKLFAIFVFALVLTASVLGQDEPNLDEAQFREPAGDFQQGFTEEQQRAMIEAQRAKLYGCYFLTKSKLFSQGGDIGKLFEGKNAEGIFKRVATDLMKNCLNQIQPLDSERIFTTLNDNSFKIEEWNNLLGFNIEAYQGDNLKLELTPDEAFIYDYYTKIDENIREQREEQESKDQRAKRSKLDFEPQIGGISLKETSPFVKTLYIAGVAVTIIFVFIFAYKKLFSTEETPYEKVKRQRLEKKGKAKTQ